MILTLALALLPAQEPGGAQLVERLKDAKTRHAALFDLLRRAGRDDVERRDPELVVCPQEGGRPPLYAVLSRFLREADDPKEFPRQDRLFPAAPTSPSARKKDLVLDVFTAAGASVAPFGGNNVLSDGYLQDVNGDGLIERLDVTKYDIGHSEVLEVSTFLEKPRPLFAVALNLDHEGWAYDWSYEIADDDKDGAWDIFLGPTRPGGGAERRVAFRWDKAKGTWAGPAAGPDDHFRVLDPARLRDSLRALVVEGKSFPPPPKPPDLYDLADPPPAGPDLPYRAASLRGLSDAEVRAYMGADEPRLFVRALVTEGFDALPPKEAALAFVEANRSAAQREQVRLAVGDLDGAAAPDVGTVTFSDQSSRCYDAVDTEWFLRCDPAGSWIAYALSWEEGVAMRGRIRDGKVYDLKFCELELAEARRILQTLWWMSRIRSKVLDGEGPGLMFTTADGKGVLRIRAAEKSVEFRGTLWAGDALAGRWRGAYTPETCLNFAQAFIEEQLPGRLGRCWPSSTIDYFNEAKLTEETPGQIEQDCLRILRHADAVSADILRVAVATAGRMGLVQALPDLRRLGAEEAIKKIESAGDPEALEAGAARGRPDEDWSLEQLRRRFPERHAAVLERRAAADPGPDNAQLFVALRKHHPARARALAASLDPARTDALAVEAFAALAEGAVPDENRRVEALLEIALDSARPWELRAQAVALLSQPRFRQPAIDEGLLGLLHPATERFVRGQAVDALSRRGGGRHVKSIVDAFRSAEDSFVQQGMLPALARAAADARAEVLRGELRETQLMLSELAWCAWAAGLRELKPEIERIATASPGAPEGARARTAGRGIKPVAGRCHAARQVAAV